MTHMYKSDLYLRVSDLTWTLGSCWHPNWQCAASRRHVHTVWRASIVGRRKLWDGKAFERLGQLSSSLEEVIGLQHSARTRLLIGCGSNTWTEKALHCNKDDFTPDRCTNVQWEVYPFPNEDRNLTVTHNLHLCASYLEHLPAYEPLKDLWPHGSSRLINLFVKKSFLSIKNFTVHSFFRLQEVLAPGDWTGYGVWDTTKIIKVLFFFQRKVAPPKSWQRANMGLWWTVNQWYDRNIYGMAWGRQVDPKRTLGKNGVCQNYLRRWLQPWHLCKTRENLIGLRTICIISSKNDESSQDETLVKTPGNQGNEM